MTQTKADRSAAAKKAAATRERNQVREDSSKQGRQAAASRFRNEAGDSIADARKKAGSVVSNTTGAVKSVGDAAFKTGKSVASRVGLGGRR